MAKPATPKPHIKAVCWDVDGVLVDSEPLHEEKIAAVAASHGIDLTAEERFNLRTIGDKRAWEWLRDNKGLELEQGEFLKECIIYFYSNTDKVIPRDGALAAFNLVADRRLPQGVVSGGTKAQVEENLVLAGVNKRVLFAVNADDVTKGKPEPEPYQLGQALMNVLRGTQIKSADFLVIEDSYVGVMAAKAAGMTVIFWPQYAGYTNPKADYTVYTKEELLKTVAAITPKPKKFGLPFGR